MAGILQTRRFVTFVKKNKTRTIRMVWPPRPRTARVNRHLRKTSLEKGTSLFLLWGQLRLRFVGFKFTRRNRVEIWRKKNSKKNKQNKRSLSSTTSTESITPYVWIFPMIRWFFSQQFLLLLLLFGLYSTRFDDDHQKGSS